MDSQFLMRIILYSAVVLIILTVVTGGALGDAIKEGLGLAKKKTDFRIDVSEKDMLSNASQFVYHRASNDGCLEDGKKPTVPKQNKGKLSNVEGYPELADTYLGQKPSCSATGATIIGGEKKDIVYETGGDMEGAYSRVSFEIKGEGPIVLRSSGDTWLEKHLLAVSKNSLEESLISECSKDFLESIADAFLSSFGGDTEARHVGTGNYFVGYFVPDDVDDRAEPWLRDELNKGVYCRKWDPEKSGDVTVVASPVGKKFDSKPQELKLCPGDEGYIQMNKGSADNTDEAGEEFTGGAYTFPHIVITHVEDEDC